MTTVKELKIEAKSLGLHNYSILRKAELIQLIDHIKMSRIATPLPPKYTPKPEVLPTYKSIKGDGTPNYYLEIENVMNAAVAYFDRHFRNCRGNFDLFKRAFEHTIVIRPYDDPNMLSLKNMLSVNEGDDIGDDIIRQLLVLSYYSIHQIRKDSKSTMPLWQSVLITECVFGKLILTGECVPITTMADILTTMVFSGDYVVYEQDVNSFLTVCRMKIIKEFMIFAKRFMRFN